VGANDSTRTASRVIPACQNLNPGLLESTCIVFHVMREDSGGMLGSWGGNRVGWLAGGRGKAKAKAEPLLPYQSISI
jgi:hypothetical protein